MTTFKKSSEDSERKIKEHELREKIAIEDCAHIKK
jgi:hypothetical protein